MFIWIHLGIFVRRSPTSSQLMAGLRQCVLDRLTVQLVNFPGVKPISAPKNTKKTFRILGIWISWISAASGVQFGGSSAEAMRRCTASPAMLSAWTTLVEQLVLIID